MDISDIKREALKHHDSNLFDEVVAAVMDSSTAHRYLYRNSIGELMLTIHDYDRDVVRVPSREPCEREEAEQLAAEILCLADDTL